VDETGEYAPEGEILQEPCEGERNYTVYRFSLDRLQTIEDPETHTVYLVPARYEANWPHAVSRYDEWFHKDLARVAQTIGSDVATLRAQFCSEDPIERAHAYRAIGEYHGFANLDSYPLQLTRGEARKRYSRKAYREAK
jgi:hypothetical protein